MDYYVCFCFDMLFLRLGILVSVQILDSSGEHQFDTVQLVTSLAPGS